MIAEFIFFFSLGGKDNGKCRWDGNPPEGWPNGIGFQNPNKICKGDLIIIIKSLQGMLNCSNPSLF